MIVYGVAEAYVFMKNEDNIFINGMALFNSSIYVLFGICLLSAGV